jgi:uncharacterized delta-60 repeat protein
MASRYQNFIKGIGLVPNTTDENTKKGDLNVTTDGKLRYSNGASSSPAVTEEHASQGANRLKNKDLEDVTTAIVDGSDTTKKIKFDAAGTTGTSTTLLSSQTVDRILTLPDATDTIVGRETSDTLKNKTISGGDNTFTNIPDGALSNNVMLLDASQTVIGNKSFNNSTLILNGSSSGSTTLNASAVASGTITLPAATDTLVGLSTSDVLTNKTLTGNTAANLVNGSGTINFNSSGTVTVPNVTDTLVGVETSDTLKNKTISGNDNTLSDIDNTSLVNSDITVNGVTIALGGSDTITASTTNPLTIGTGLSGTSFDGSAPVTIAIDSTVVTLSGVQTLSNKTLTNPEIDDTIKSVSGKDLSVDSPAGKSVILKNAGSTSATVSSTGIDLASGKLLKLINNSQTVGIQASPSASASYTITIPASAPSANTSLTYNGTDYIWGASGGGGGGTATNVPIVNNQSAFTNTGVFVDVINDVGFTIDYAAERQFTSVSSLPNASVMSNIVVNTINKFNASILSSVVMPSGKILVAGNFANYAGTTGRDRLILFNSDGSVDTAFCANATDGAKFNNDINFISAQSDGKILAGGTFTAYAGTVGRDRLIRLNSDGTLDTAFCVNAADSSKFSGTINTVLVQSDGKILVGGAFTTYAGTANRSRLIRLNSDGTLDTAFCANATDGAKFVLAVTSLFVQSDGKILVGGSFISYAGTLGRGYFIRLNGDGTLDTAFCANATDGSRFSATVNAISVQTDGKILVGGAFTSYGGTTGRNSLIRLNSDGTLDTTFCVNASDGTKFSASILHVAVQSDGRILVGGNFTAYAGTANRNRLIRLNSDGTLDTAFCVNATDGNKFSSQTTSITVLAGDILFIAIAGIYPDSLNRGVFLNSDGTKYNTLNEPIIGATYSFNGEVSRIVLQSDGKILICGGFTSYSGFSGRNRLIRLNSDGTVDTAFCANASDGTKFAAAVNAISVQSDGKILVGGAFTSYGGTLGRDYFIRLNSDGTLDTAFCVNAADGSKFNTSIDSIAIQSDGKILVGGLFTNYAGTTGRNRLIRLNSDGTLDTAFCTNAVDGTKFNNIIYSLVVQSDGKILVGGNFANYAGTTTRNNLIRLNSDGTLDTAFCANASDGTKFNATVSSIAIQTDGKILIGGFFNNYAGTAGRDRLVRLNSDGTVDSTFCFFATDSAKFNNTVTAIAVQADGRILVGGFFTNYAGTTGRNRLIRLEPTGLINTIFVNSASDGSKVSSVVNSIVSDSSYNVYIGGNFIYNNQNRSVVIMSLQPYAGINQSQIGTGKIHGYINADGSIVSGNAYAELGSSGINLQVNSSTGNIQYTSNNIYLFQDYQLTSGSLRLLPQNL